MERTTVLVFLLALMGFVCGGGYEYPKGGNNFPHPGGQYPPYPGHPGPVYPPTGPNYPFPGYPGGPPDCDIACIPEFCMPPFATCPNFPQARCVGVCCVARFFIGGVDVTPFCRGPTIPGIPHKKY